MTPKETLREEFKKRYEKSAIYDKMYIDWFPDDVMEWWLSKRDSELKDLIKTVEGMKISQNWSISHPMKQYSVGHNKAIDDITSKIKELL